MARVINFSAGPATLPLPALEYAHNEFLDHEGTGMSLIEHSHRGAAYAKVHEETKSLFRELMNVPDTHEVLFMQ
ncbi:MAG: aminotransferase class V-fold PLP-dependent enzyme, partial [Polyangiales bacterium]